MFLCAKKRGAVCHWPYLGTAKRLQQDMSRPRPLGRALPHVVPVAFNLAVSGRGRFVVDRESDDYVRKMLKGLKSVPEGKGGLDRRHNAFSYHPVKFEMVRI